MPDITQRIADILLGHTHSVPFEYCCCGAEPDTPEQWTAHVAEVLTTELGLTREWGNTWMGQGPAINQSREEAQKAIGYFREKFPDSDHDLKVVSRFVTDWVPDE